ncbi:hypothetical protein YC2023_051714 [Brassica napus]
MRKCELGFIVFVHEAESGAQSPSRCLNPQVFRVFSHCLLAARTHRRNQCLAQIALKLFQGSIYVHRLNTFKHLCSVGPAPVPLEFFSFCLYEQLMELANKNTQFLGIIGEVTQVSNVNITFNEESQTTQHIMEAIQIDGFGEDGVTSSASYTKYGDVQKIETVTVLKLNAYVLKSRCRYISLLVSEFLCTNKVEATETTNGWCYIFCYKCSRKLQRGFPSFTCTIGVVRYCPAASVADPLESEVSQFLQEIVGTGSGDVQLNPTCPLTTTTGAEEHTGVGSSAEEPHVSSAERELKKAHKA